LTVKPKKLSVIIRNEVHSGQIMPNTPEEVVELKSKFPDSKIELRTMKPSLQFQKWSKQVPTQEDRISPVMNENGEQILPDDQYLSSYYQIANYINDIFKCEMKQRTERGSYLMVYLNQNKNTTAKEAREKIGHVNDCDTIISDDDANTIREKYPNMYNEIMKGILTISNTKVGTIIQERISDKALKNKGAKLPNPMTRITIPFDTKTGLPVMVTILDKNKPFKCNGRRGYEDAKYNNVPINSNNIHLFIPSRSVIDSVVSMDSVCFSQLGISLPIKASLIVVQQPMKRENNIYNMCCEMYGDEFDNDTESVAESTITLPNNNTDTESTNKYNDSLLNDLSA